MYWAVHEALVDADNSLYWVGGKPLYKYDNYHDAVEAWSKKESKSAYLDIMDSDEVSHLYDRVDYSEIEELDFND